MFSLIVIKILTLILLSVILLAFCGLLALSVFIARLLWLQQKIDMSVVAVLGILLAIIVFFSPGIPLLLS